MKAGNNRLIVRPPLEARADTKKTSTGFEFIVSTMETSPTGDGRHIYNENTVVNTLCTIVMPCEKITDLDSFITEDGKILKYSDMYAVEDMPFLYGDRVWIRYDELTNRNNWFLKDGEWLLSVSIDSVLGFSFLTAPDHCLAPQGKAHIEPIEEKEKIEEYINNSKIILPDSLRRKIKDNYVGEVLSAGHPMPGREQQVKIGDIVVYNKNSEVALFPDYDNRGNIDLVVAYNPVDILLIIRK